METKNLKTNELSKQAKADIKRVSAFYFINELNKLAKKNEFCENVNLAEISTRLKTLHGGRYGFTAELLTKDYQGRFCSLSTISSDRVRIIHEGLNIETGTELVYDSITGYELFTNEKDGKYTMLRPIAPTLISYITAFVAVLRRAEKKAQEEELAKQQAEKLAKQQQENKVTKKTLLADYKAGRITGEEFAEKYALLVA